MNYTVIIDTETTGLVNAKACEIAWLVIDESYNILDQQVHLTDPEQLIEKGAYAIHGISNDNVKGWPANSTICKLIPRPLVWIGHNAVYDQRVLGSHLEWSADLCTLALARRYIPYGTTNHKLPTLQKELKLTAHVSHRALGDVLTTLELLKLISQLSCKSLPELLELESKPKMIQKMPFGMYKGYNFAEIPKPYRQWMMSQAEWPKDIAYTLERLRLV